MATKKGVKKKEHEKLDDATIERVIMLLEDPKPITKKQACEILNISYNTTRLNTIIEEYKEKKERRKRNFARVKGTPVTDSEISTIVTSFIQGHPLSDISDFTFRSPSIIKRVLDDIGVPTKPRGDEAYKNTLLPEESILKEKPKIGEILWSAKYHACCEVISFFQNNDGTESVKIYVYEPVEGARKGGYYAYQPMLELGSLRHLEKYIDLKRLTS